MFVVVGVTGKTGRVVAQTLLAQGEPVRVVVRSPAKGAGWKNRGAEVAVASLDDRVALERALDGASALFTLLPEDATSEDFHEQRRRIVDATAAAVSASSLSHVVFLSTTAAVLANGNGAAKDLHYAETELRATGKRVTILRATALQENVATALGPAQSMGVYPCFLPRSDIALPMVATKDVGRLAAHCLVDPPARSQVIDVTGPAVSVEDMARVLGRALGKSLQVAIVPREAQVAALVQAGLSHAFAEAVVELTACTAAGRAQAVGDRVWAGVTTLEETVKAVVGGAP